MWDTQLMVKMYWFFFQGNIWKFNPWHLVMPNLKVLYIIWFGRLFQLIFIVKERNLSSTRWYFRQPAKKIHTKILFALTVSTARVTRVLSIYRVGHADTCWPGSGWFWIRFRFITRALSHYRDNRPCFNRSYGLSDRRVFFHVDRTIDGAVPNRRFVGPVHHVYLDLNCPRQHSVPTVLSNGFQSVALSLGVNKKVRMLVTNVEISKSSTVETTMKYTS